MSVMYGFCKNLLFPAFKELNWPEAAAGMSRTTPAKSTAGVRICNSGFFKEFAKIRLPDVQKYCLAI
ncbi:MAG: hypothetical protein JSS82_07495 [Bacteroidetes bacterium]|nr:hypothetical protein [Bacteroidota bacterium]